MLTLHYESIQTAFASLKDKSKVLALHVLNDLKTLPLWVNKNKTGGNAGFTNNRDLVIHALSSFDPDPFKTPQETFICQSVVMANEMTPKLVNAVNDAKNTFKRACLDYRAIQSSHSKYAKEIRKILSFAGLGHISLKHAYRNLVYLHYQPRLVSWSLYNKTSIKKITIDDARKLLLDLGTENPAIQIQLSKLNLLDINDKLAIKTISKPYSSANVFKHDEGDPQLIATSLPIFIKHDPCLSLPIIKLSTPRTKNVKPRSDRLLEAEPFLNSIDAFRYNISIKQRLTDMNKLPSE